MVKQRQSQSRDAFLVLLAWKWNFLCLHVSGLV